MSTETRTRGRQPLPPPSARERRQLEKLYVTEGLTVAEVAERLGTTPRRAKAMLVRAGIPLRRRGPRPLGPPAERRLLERLYVSEGLTVSEIARRLGVSRERAEGMLTRAGVTLRRNGGKVALPPPAELGRLYMEEQLTTRALAARFGVHQRVAWKALKEAGVPARRRGSWCKPKWPERVPRELLHDLYVGERLDIDRVAQRLGVSRQTVSRALHGYGIPVDRGRRQRRRPSPEELVELFVPPGRVHRRAGHPLRRPPPHAVALVGRCRHRDAAPGTPPRSLAESAGRGAVPETTGPGAVS